MTRTRRIVQGLFLVLVLGGVFLLEANCERWCPFGGVEALYTYVAEGDMLCSLGVSNFFILGGVLAATLLLRRAFCGYMCPLGAIGEWIRAAAQSLRIPPVSIAPRWDRLLSLLKYLVLVVLLVWTYRAGELVFRGYDPCYALLSRHGEDITYWAYVISAMLVFASVVVVLPFCRWFCPLAAVLNVFSRFGWTRVQRDDQSCRGCGKCARKCPMAIPVDQVLQVTHARCMACLACVEACPSGVSRDRALQWGPPGRRARNWPQWALIALLLSCTMGAVSASYLVSIPSFVKSRGDRPAAVSMLKLNVEDLTCRGRANLFAYFLQRDDLFAVGGYLHIAAWPGPGRARVEITFDPSVTDEMAIKQAITEPYFETDSNSFRQSPFQIEGYDPLQLDDSL